MPSIDVRSACSRRAAVRFNLSHGLVRVCQYTVIFMPVCSIVQTINPRCRGRPNALKFISNIIYFLKAHFGYLENSVDPDQPASSTYSCIIWKEQFVFTC